MLPLRATAALLVLTALVSPVWAEDSAQQTVQQTWGDWSKVCTTDASGPQVCQLVQSANKNKTGELVFQTAIGRVPDSDTPFIYLTAPLGIFLPRGISIVIDDHAPITAVVQRCDGNGCLALLALTDEIAGFLRSGKEAQIVFAVNAQQNVFVPLSLNGITDALKAI